MLFNSYIFIFLFLPLALAGWYGLNRFKLYGWGRVFLVLMSLWFYGWFNPSYLLIILGSLVVNYGLYVLLNKYRDTALADALLIAGVIFNLGLLSYYKYRDFFAENLAVITGREPILKGILLPLGISFFTFQQLGFIIDAKKGEAGDYSLEEYALFVCFFPQLIAGPIVTHQEMIPQFRESAQRGIDEQLIASGIYSFALGLGKKVLLADVFGAAVDAGYGMENYNGGLIATAVLIGSYSLQLYFDFSGYCDMARGLGMMFGIRLPNNFNSPYKAENPVDFWRRWHITLGRFFTKYVYIPLGGNRKGLIRTCLNLMVVFILSGLWHGAGWNYVIWGTLHGLSQVMYRIYEALFKKDGYKHSPGNNIITGDINIPVPKKNIGNWLSCIATIILVSILEVFFRADSITHALSILKGLEPFKDNLFYIPGTMLEGFSQKEFFYILKLAGRLSAERINLILMWLYTITGWGICLLTRNLAQETKNFCPSLKKAVAASLVFLWAVASLSGVSRFLYFNF